MFLYYFLSLFSFYFVILVSFLFVNSRIISPPTPVRCASLSCLIQSNPNSLKHLYSTQAELLSVFQRKCIS